MNLEDKATTYSWDQPLFKELGLEPFEVYDQKEHYIGEVKGDDGSLAKIWVTCLPAQFWRFEVHVPKYPQGKNVTHFTTGSGSFSDYWHIARVIMDGMVRINKLETMEIEQ